MLDVTKGVLVWSLSDEWKSCRLLITSKKVFEPQYDLLAKEDSLTDVSSIVYVTFEPQYEVLEKFMSLADWWMHMD